tara:strand:- start:31690 stop:31890 length:201 start_codon:yes stop_codon:yes gene_type:complete
MKQRCPKCGSDNITKYDPDLTFIKCNACGYDELDSGPMPSDPRNKNREKNKFNPYKSGGPRRSHKQ